jgi:hypothetical protein
MFTLFDILKLSHRLKESFKEMNSRIIIVAMLLKWNSLSSQAVHQTLDFYKTDSISTFPDRFNFYVAYLRVTLDSLSEGKNSQFKYTYNYDYYLEFKDENLTTASDSLLIRSQTVKYYVIDSTIYCFQEPTENSLHFHLNNTKSDTCVFINNGRNNSGIGFFGSKINVAYSFEDIKITIENPVDLIELVYLRTGGIGRIRLKQLGVFGPLTFDRCSEEDVPFVLRY